MPWMLLTQSVAFGHSHGGNQPAGHDLRAHIHLNQSTIDDAHSHTHHHGLDKHNHHDAHHSDRENQNSSQLESPFDHDSSALYLSSNDVILGSRSTIKTAIKVLFQWDSMGSDLPSDSLQPPEPVWGLYGCAPPDSDSPLFVRHNAYLI
tara:strand:+ start:1150 stop:1596 length:447 start_codon:yes stop_codon:yes gene_type:complete